MKKIKLPLLCLTFWIFCSHRVSAQAAMITGGNVIKVNLSAVAISHYSLQYERVTGPNQSFAIGFGISPDVELPFKSTLLDQFGDEEDARTAIESMKFTKFTVTPEYRFYISKKGAPKGFYLATFARYTNMSIKDTYEFTPSSGKKHYMEVEGSFNGYGAGAMLGIQWLLGKSVTLDWWIVGPFIGVMSSKFTGVDHDTSDILTEQDERDLEQDINDIEIPLWTLDAKVDNMKADVDLSGPFYGVRMMGLSLGVRF